MSVNETVHKTMSCNFLNEAISSGWLLLDLSTEGSKLPSIQPQTFLPAQEGKY